jgi:hypothetical protein
MKKRKEPGRAMGGSRDRHISCLGIDRHISRCRNRKKLASLTEAQKLLKMGRETVLGDTQQQSSQLLNLT